MESNIRGGKGKDDQEQVRLGSTFPGGLLSSMGQILHKNVDVEKIRGEETPTWVTLDPCPVM